MFTRLVDFNRFAERWAAQHQKPVVGNCDVHRLMQLGSTYSLIDADPDADAICDAIRAGRVQVVSRPLGSLEAARIVSAMMLGYEPGVPVGDTGRACPTPDALTPSIGGLRISNGDISQS
ncbi:MAG TPA: PHP-associated domain-containing protein [Vicinamibacterales bacterium]|nr:PHP-associated domain-containing protein [Vicinamibacterales bacterium]